MFKFFDRYTVAPSACRSRTASVRPSCRRRSDSFAHIATGAAAVPPVCHFSFHIYWNYMFPNWYTFILVCFFLPPPNPAPLASPPPPITLPPLPHLSPLHRAPAWVPSNPPPCFAKAWKKRRGRPQSGRLKSLLFSRGRKSFLGQSCFFHNEFFLCNVVNQKFPIQCKNIYPRFRPTLGPVERCFFPDHKPFTVPSPDPKADVDEFNIF